jgi:uncharacterized protein YkwD
VINTCEVLAVHHNPADPPRSSRVAEAPSRWALLGRRPLRHRSARLALGAMVSTVLTAVVLAGPTAAGTGAGSALPGQNAGPESSESVARLTTAATFSSATVQWRTAPWTTRWSAGDAAPSTPAPAPAPEPSAEPAPAPPAAAPSTTAPETVPAPAPAPVAPAGDGDEAQVLALVNDERAAAGCGAVTADDGLAAVARAHSEDMRDRGFFGHVNPDGLDPFERADQAGVTARAENIARGQQDPAAVMDAWMNSAGHRANILNCDLTRLGVGIARGDGGPWWTQLFG